MLLSVMLRWHNFLKEAVAKQADLDTPLKTADNLLEPETLNNVSAKKMYHMDFHVPSTFTHLGRRTVGND